VIVKLKRSTSCDLTEKILKVLAADPNQKKTIQDISRDTNIGWESTKRHIELLEKLKSVRKIEEEGKIFYQKVGTIASDTLFSIPLSEENRKTIEQIYRTIKDTCSDCGIPLSKTLIQKIAVDFVDKNYPNIPRGWYLYGEMLLLPFKPEKEYTEPLTKPEDIRLIREICMDYKRFADKSRKIRRHQYEKRDNKLYLTKENLYDALVYSDLKEGYSKNLLRKLLNEFLSYCERREGNSMMLALVDDYCSQALAILRHGDDKLLNDARPALIEAFNAIWSLVGTYEFYYSLSEKQFYDKELLNDYLGEKKNTLEDTATEALEDLHEYKPKISIPEDDITQKLRELIGSGKELTAEEKKKRQKELETMTFSDLIRKYGLDKM
jgi:hypothetical protein